MIILGPLLAGFAGAVAQSAVGFGIALFIGPVMLLLLDPSEAVTGTLVAASSVSAMMLTAERRRLQLDPRVAASLVGAALPGVVAGAIVIGLVDKAYLQVAVGLVVISLVAVQQRERRRGQEPTAEFGPRPSALPTGAIAGFLNTAISAGGPPLVIWMRTMRVGADQMRHTLALVFLALNSATITAIAVAQGIEIEGDWLRAVSAAIAGVPFGYAIGARASRRFDRRTFSELVFVLVCALALLSISAGVGALV